MYREYASNLTNRQWRLIRPLIPAANRLGRRRICRRRIIDAILYWVRTGCQWRYLPREFPNWSTVYGVFRKWKQSGTWERIHDRLVRQVRKQAGKKPTPSVGIIDSQSIRTAEGGVERSFDGAKKITGRKRHIIVDSLGLLIRVVVHGAGWQDYEGAHFLIQQLRDKYWRLKLIFGDSAYGKKGLPEWSQQTNKIDLQTVKRSPDAEGFEVLPKRWIVERTFAWLIRYRRLSRDYEKDPETSEVVTMIAMTSLMGLVEQFVISCVKRAPLEGSSSFYGGNRGWENQNTDDGQEVSGQELERVQRVTGSSWRRDALAR